MSWWSEAGSIGTAAGLGAEIHARAPGTTLYYIGDSSHQESGRYPSDGASDHNPCQCHDAVCAVDVMQGGGTDLQQLADHLADRAKTDRRISYVIWNRRICSGPDSSHPAGVWRSYSGSNPHTDHVHLSINHGPDRYDDTAPWGWAAGGTADLKPEEEDDMPYLCKSPAGDWWIVDAGTLMHVASPDDLDDYTAAGMKTVGPVSSAQWGLYEKLKVIA